MQRIQLPSPVHWDNIQINNGSIAKKSVIDWRFHIPLDALEQFDALGVETSTPAPMWQVFRAVGSHARLWIDSCQGTIAPMDAEPHGWTYSGVPFESENGWEWTPDNFSEQKLLAEANSAMLDADGLLDKHTSVLKMGVPFQVFTRHNQVKSFEEIPLQHLAGMIRTTSSWVFEFER